MEGAEPETSQGHLRVRGVPAVLWPGHASVQDVFRDGAAEREGPPAEARSQGASGKDAAWRAGTRPGAGAPAIDSRGSSLRLALTVAARL